MDASQRRWAEIRFYYFSLDIYRIHNDLLDVATMIEAIGMLTKGSKIERLKALSAKLLSDIGSTPTLIEMITLMRHHKYPISKIAETTGKSQRTITRYLKQNPDQIYIPSLKEADDELINNFMKTVELIKQAGIITQ